MENSYFNGTLLQQIGYSILGAFITIITLGICAPWAITMMESWKAKHSVIDGKRLVFVGSAISLFGHWIKWWILTIITLGIYSFWLNIKMKQWVTKHTHFAD